MATASREVRPRPPIQPIHTTGPGHGFQAVRTGIVFKSPAWLVTPRSPMSRLPPLYPDSEDERMREHDKAAVDRLEPRSRRNSLNSEATPHSFVLKPISELTLAIPLSLSTQRPPLSAPLPPLSAYHRPTIEETRSMLFRDAERYQHAAPPHALGRRGSAPPGSIRERNLQLQRQRGHFRRREFIDSYHRREADLLVVPVDLKRLSTIAVHGDDGEIASPHPIDGRLTTRVVIHSRNRKPLVLTRTFDINELHATIPGAVEIPNFPSSRRASITALQVPTPVTGTRLRSPRSPSSLRGRRYSSARLPNPNIHGSPGLENTNIRHRYAAAPMHLEYARKYLPVLAAIILSEIVQPGDTLELPLPHPRAWEETVAYIYTGRVEVTELIRQNITYLGGRV